MLRVFQSILILSTAAGTASERAPLQHDAYVWQRAWTEAVTNAAMTLAPQFGELIALQVEVSWDHGSPRCTKVDLDYAALRASGKPVGLALRIGSFSGPFAENDSRTRYLASLSQSLIADAAVHQLPLAELQLDFDCAESKLEGYRVWLESIQKAVHPLPVTITALPSWLRQPAFRTLVEAADGYVLQVHSFERPRSPETALTLCDPQAARSAVARASQLGRPFRVALPTYGYVVAFDERGGFLGLSAEGPARHWPVTARLVEVRANPAALSALVREWNLTGPPELTGVIWYRLPVVGDALNWPWPTLQCVMRGQSPTANVRVEVRGVKPGLVEIDLVNEGTADAPTRTVATVRWTKHRRIASDAIHGYQLVEIGPNALRFKPAPSEELLRPGERIVIGWIRFDGDPEVKAELDELAN